MGYGVIYIDTGGIYDLMGYNTNNLTYIKWVIKVLQGCW